MPLEMSKEDSLKFRDDVAKRSQNRALKLEARRLILQCRKAGICDESMKTDPTGFLDPIWYADKGLDAVSIAARMFTEPRCWADSGSIVLVDGGDQQTRSLVAGVCVFRGMMRDAMSGELTIKVVRLAEILPVLVSYSYDRANMIDSLKTHRILCLSELDPKSSPSKSNEGGRSMDAIIASRMSAKLPTIFTLSSVAEKFDTKTLYGNVFESILNSSHDEARGVWKLRLKERA